MTFVRNNLFLALLLSGLFASSTCCFIAHAESTVYQVYRGIDMGDTDRPPPKDIFISMGAGQGLHKGSVLDVYRRISSFDNMTQKHMGDHMIPVGRIKIIYVDDRTAIARQDKFVSIDQEPALLPQAVMIGDIVRLSSN
jgi:hypothetical protein